MDTLRTAEFNDAFIHSVDADLQRIFETVKGIRMKRAKFHLSKNFI